MATETHEAVASACVDAHGGAIGMPQLCAEWIPNQIFWLLITLAALFFVMSRIALPRIAAVLAERSGRTPNSPPAGSVLSFDFVRAGARGLYVWSTTLCNRCV